MPDGGWGVVPRGQRQQGQQVIPAPRRMVRPSGFEPPREAPPSGQGLDYYSSCDRLFCAMNFHDLKSGRLARGLSQVQAATRLGVSQPYLAMLEGGSRRLTPELARRAMKVYDLSPAVLPPSELLSRHRMDAET
ncbi:MAG: helix-turn-helix domain-containing protein, partial [Candidatus Methylomirabilales bacterium]